jgi:HAE1 family hydrophobic/amphiphilic exporter-1
LENKLAENDETFQLYLPNIEMVPGFGLLDPTRPAGVLIVNPFIRFDDSNQTVYQSLNPFDPNPTLSSMAKGTLFSGNLPTSIAMVTKETGFSSIYSDGKYRTLNVIGQIETGYNVTKVSSEVNAAVNVYLSSEEFLSLSEGILIEFAGENEAIQNAFEDLTIALVVAILLVYMIMAIQFQSLVYPLIVMGTIPLAFTGGFLALLITGGSLNIVSIMGMVILVGIVVNNGIVLIDYINQLRDQGRTIREAMIEAGKTRLRPIFMTALTTILALTGMALGFGEGAELLQPLAVTAIGGLIYSTILTLIVIPLIYCLVNTKKMAKEGRSIECGNES